MFGDFPKQHPMKPSLLIAGAVALFGTLPLHAQSPYTADSNTLILYHFDEEPGISTVIDNSGHDRNAARGDANSGGATALPGMGYAQSPTSGLSSRTNWTEPNGPTDPASFLYTLGQGDFTIEAWIRLDDLDFTGNRNIMAIQSGTVVQPDLSFSILKNANGVFLALGDVNGPNRAYTSGVNLGLQVDQWYHIAVTGTDNGNGTSTYRFYFNSPGADTDPSPIYTTTNTYMAPGGENTVPRRLEIGNYYGSSGTAFFPGSIDEFRISDVARTTFETLQPIPEPSQVALVLAGGALVAGQMLKKTNKKQLRYQ